MWYKPDAALFSDMILMLGKNKLISEAEELFSELKKEGLEPDTRAYTELIGAYVQVDMLEKAIETYEFMKASGCVPDKLTLIILIRNLESAGKGELAAQLKKECYKYLDSAKTFLKEAERTFVSYPICSVSTFQIPTLIVLVIGSHSLLSCGDVPACELYSMCHYPMNMISLFFT